MSTNRLRALSGCLALAALAACGGDGPTQPPPSLAVSTTGRLERSSIVAVSVSNAGAALAPGQVVLSFSPAGAAQNLGDGTVRLLAAGQVTITATSGNLVGNVEVDVATPPVVVFDRLTGGNRDIWKVDLDGQNLTQLTTDVGDDQDPTVVKGTVVFVSYRGGNGDLYSIPLAGGTTTRLTTTARDETTPSLSADGTKLAFSYVPTDVTKIFTSASNGTGAARLVPGTGAEVIETAPTWAAGGAVAYVSTASGSADIVQATAGGAPIVLAGSGSADVEPAFSADGQSLVFVSNRTGSVELFVLKGGTTTQLTSGAGSKFNPTFTPDGRVVYVELASGVTRLKWVDPASPATVTTIDTGTGTVGHPAVNLP